VVQLQGSTLVINIQANASKLIFSLHLRLLPPSLILGSSSCLTLRLYACVLCPNSTGTIIQYHSPISQSSRDYVRLQRKQSVRTAVTTSGGGAWEVQT